MPRSKATLLRHRYYATCRQHGQLGRWIAGDGPTPGCTKTRRGSPTFARGYPLPLLRSYYSDTTDFFTASPQKDARSRSERPQNAVGTDVGREKGVRTLCCGWLVLLRLSHGKISTSGRINRAPDPFRGENSSPRLSARRKPTTTTKPQQRVLTPSLPPSKTMQTFASVLCTLLVATLASADDVLFDSTGALAVRPIRTVAASGVSPRKPLVWADLPGFESSADNDRLWDPAPDSPDWRRVE